MKDYVHDKWRWILDPINGYSVKGTYQYLTRLDTSVEHGLYNVVWLKQVSLKASIFVWRLLRNELPTKDNLVRRRALHHEDIFCIGGCGCQETTNHLFFSCDIFGNVWLRVYQWLGFSFISPNSRRDHFHQSFISPNYGCDHFHQFGHMAGLLRLTHSFFKVTWHACVWTI